VLIGAGALAEEGEATTERRVDAGSGYRGLPGAVDPGEPGKANGWVEVGLKIVPETEWKFRTPNDTLVEKGVKGNWVCVTNGELPLTGTKGGRIRFEPKSANLMLDADGDGTFETPVTGELVSVRAKRPDGTDGPFHFRLRRAAPDYWYSRACMAVGKFNDQTIALIDEDNDGCFGGKGKDAIRTGSSIVAIAHSPIVNLRNELFHVRVNQAGTKAWFKKYEGPTGKVDLASKYKANSPILYATIQQGDCVFNGAEKGAVVPVGEWTLVDGLVGPSIYQSAKILRGSMAPISVKEGETTTVAWGMAGRIDFSVEKNGNQLRIPVSSIKIYGQAGEEYVNFRPKVFSPFVQVVETKTQREVLHANMGMGC
jgi:hypothetical protein